MCAVGFLEECVCVGWVCVCEMPLDLVDIVFLVNLVPPAGLNASVGLSVATRASLHSQAPLSPESKINCTHAVNKNKKYGERERE